MKALFLIFITFSMFSCNRPDPQPELQDAIYRDLVSQLGITKKNIEDFSKILQEQEAAAASVKPQTGQIKYAEKRVWETRNHLQKLQQQEKYWKLRIAERQVHARAQYLRAFKEGKTWPDPEEVKQYMSEKRLRQASQQWDAKDRIKDFQKSEAKETRSSQ